MCGVTMASHREDLQLRITILLVSLLSAASGQSDSSSSSVVVAGYNLSAPVSSSVVLQCVSGRMVWTRDRVRDRQRVVHWDLYRARHGYGMERVLDMFSAGDQRIYNSYNRDRVGLNPSAFKDGNFSLLIKDVTVNDAGLYSCNLHHLYCHLYETVRVQLNITKSRRKEQRYWDGQKAVYVVLLGSTVVLPCVNRRKVWTDWTREEEEQQVVHWDRQSPGALHERADRLVDLYASGEQRSYGPAFLQRKMNISSTAFSEGDFSLTISNLQPSDQGVYSCHLHHHYCGLHERREFLLSVEPRAVQTTLPPKALPSEAKETPKPERPSVINVVLPDHRHSFLLPLGYVLTVFLLLAFTILTIILVSRRRGAQEVQPQVSIRSHSSSEGFQLDEPHLATLELEETTFDYKNNLLKETTGFSLPAIDLDKELQKFSK
ncbi:matrix remodeling-associated protein 8-like [Synchiropus picturatus]